MAGILLVTCRALPNRPDRAERRTISALIRLRCAKATLSSVVAKRPSFGTPTRWGRKGSPYRSGGWSIASRRWLRQFTRDMRVRAADNQLGTNGKRLPRPQTRLSFPHIRKVERGRLRRSAPVGTPRMWTLGSGHHEDHTHQHTAMRPLARPQWQHLRRAGGGNNSGSGGDFVTGALAIPVAWLVLREKRMGDRLLSGSGRSRPRWPAPLVEPGAVFAHLLALRRRRVALAG
jgi:hypothetical protein